MLVRVVVCTACYVCGSLQILVNPHLRGHVTPFIKVVRSSLLLEPSEEETCVQAEPVTEEEQEPVYFAEPGKPPSKNPLMSYYFTKHVLFSKIK